MSQSWYGNLPKYYQRQIAAMGLDDAGMTRRRLLKIAGAAAGPPLLASRALLPRRPRK